MKRKPKTPTTAVEAMVVGVIQNGLTIELADWQQRHVFELTEAQARSLIGAMQDRLSYRNADAGAKGAQ